MHFFGLRIFATWDSSIENSRTGCCSSDTHRGGPWASKSFRRTWERASPALLSHSRQPHPVLPIPNFSPPQGLISAKHPLCLASAVPPPPTRSIRSWASAYKCILVSPVSEKPKTRITPQTPRLLDPQGLLATVPFLSFPAQQIQGLWNRFVHSLGLCFLTCLSLLTPFREGCTPLNLHGWPPHSQVWGPLLCSHLTGSFCSISTQLPIVYFMTQFFVPWLPTLWVFLISCWLLAHSEADLGCWRP